MDWLCTFLEDNHANIISDNISTQHPYNSTNPTYQSITSASDQGEYTSDKQNSLPWDFMDYSNKIVIPCLCVFGLIGNFLNLVILGKRIREGKKNICFSMSSNLTLQRI